MSVLGIIPARGGSKGVPGKNIESIAGKPLIGYTIDVAIESNIFDTLVVTSDDEQILSYASTFNLLLHKREKTLATDTSPVIDTIIEVLNFAEKQKKIQFDYIYLLQVTAPLREKRHLQEALEKFKNHRNAASLISVTKMEDKHPARMYKIADDFLESLSPEQEQLNRQQLSPVYIRNGSIYITRRDVLLSTRSIMAKPSIAYEMAASYYLNIDTLQDMLLAKILLNKSNTY